MISQELETSDGVTLIGGGDVQTHDVLLAQSLAPHVLAADGGADKAIALGVSPRAVIGDLDSVSAATLQSIGAAQSVKVHDQDTTDLDKCLDLIKAPFILGVGFLGGRLDHELAAFSSLLRSAGKAVVLIGEQDVVFAVPSFLKLDLPKGTRFSLFPLLASQGTSQGLNWPIDGLTLEPGGRIGTSNEVIGSVEVTTKAPGLIGIVPKDCLRPVIQALRG